MDLAGTLDNTGATLTLDATTGPWNLRGGTIQGGTVATGGGALLVGTTAGGTLAGVTLAGTLDLTTASNAYVAVTGGLTLAGGTVNVGGGTNYGRLQFGGTQALGGTGTVAFAGTGPYNLLQVATAGTTLTIGPGVVVRGQSGTVGYSPVWGGPSNVAVVNQGTIQADVAGGTIAVNGTGWSNAGTMRALNGGTLRLDGSFTTAGPGKVVSSGGSVDLTGVLDNTGATLTLDATTGPYNLRGGTIQGGTVATGGGALLVGTTAGGTLTGVTLAGTLDLTTASNAYVAVTGGLTLAGGTVNVGGGTNYGRLQFAGTQALGGTGTVAFAGTGPYNLLQVATAGTALTIGPGVVVRGQSGTVGYSPVWGGPSNVAVVNQGTIQADVAGGTIAVNGTGWSNAATGTLRLNGGTCCGSGAMPGSWSRPTRRWLDGSFTTAGLGKVVQQRRGGGPGRGAGQHRRHADARRDDRAVQPAGRGDPGGHRRHRRRRPARRHDRRRDADGRDAGRHARPDDRQQRLRRGHRRPDARRGHGQRRRRRRTTAGSSSPARRRWAGPARSSSPAPGRTTCSRWPRRGRR